MKKVFKFALVAFAAAAVAVACNKPAADPTPTPTPDPDPDPQPEEVVPVEGTSDWAIIGTLLGSNWDKDYKSAQDGDIYVVKNVKLEAATEFKWRDTTSGNGGWDINRGGTFAALGEAFDVAQNGANIKPGLDGVYDIYLNLAVDQAAIVAKDGAQPTWKEKPAPQPEGNEWDYVFNTTDWHINCKADFAEALTINTGHMAMQWKFLSTKWNVYNKVDEERGYWVGCNRLGQLYDGDYGGEGILLRFGDGEVSGMLRLNGGAIIDNAYVTKDNANYVWSLNEWHVLTLVADGTNVSVYDNAELVTSIPQSKAAHDWTFAALDFSETMDDGDVMYVKGQAFLGYTAYIRMWDKALSAEEVAASLCDVDPASEGLKAYWVFNYDEGYVVEDQAGKNDFDFSKIKSAADDNGGKIKDNSQAVEGAWTSVELELLPEVCAAE